MQILIKKINSLRLKIKKNFSFTEKEAKILQNQRIQI